LILFTLLERIPVALCICDVCRLFGLNSLPMFFILADAGAVDRFVFGFEPIAELVDVAGADVEAAAIKHVQIVQGGVRHHHHFRCRDIAAQAAPVSTLEIRAEHQQRIHTKEAAFLVLVAGLVGVLEA
jgi:hypothetical protein